jgi:hypothetical protein
LMHSPLGPEHAAALGGGADPEQREQAGPPRPLLRCGSEPVERKRDFVHALHHLSVLFRLHQRCRRRYRGGRGGDGGGSSSKSHIEEDSCDGGSGSDCEADDTSKSAAASQSNVAARACETAGCAGNALRRTGGRAEVSRGRACGSGGGAGAVYNPFLIVSREKIKAHCHPTTPLASGWRNGLTGTRHTSGKFVRQPSKFGRDSIFLLTFTPSGRPPPPPPPHARCTDLRRALGRRRTPSRYAHPLPLCENEHPNPNFIYLAIRTEIGSNYMGIHACLLTSIVLLKIIGYTCAQPCPLPGPPLPMIPASPRSCPSKVPCPDSCLN